MVERLVGDFESLDVVERTNSTYVISTLYDSHRALQSYSLETLLEVLTDE
jgi:hypothetical protein